MAWSVLPLAAGDPIQPGAFLDLSTAYNERRQAVGQSASTIAGNPGDNIQQATGATYASYADWQIWIEANCTAFIRADLTYDGGGAPASIADWSYTLATFRTAAGLNAAGFTRRYWRSFAGLFAPLYDDGGAFTNGDKAINSADGQVYSRVAGAWVSLGGPWNGIAPDVVTAYGTMLPGDIIDHVTLNELYQAFHALRWQLLLLSLDPTGGDNEGDNNPGRGGAPLYTVWGPAKADAQASWDTGTPAPSKGVRDAPARPVCYSLGYWDYVGSTPVYTAELQGQRIRYAGDLSTVWAGVSRAADFYAYATAPPAHQTAGPGDLTFDDNGDGLIQDDWKLVSTTGATTSTATQYTPYLGKSAAADYPAWCAEPLPAPTPFDPGPTLERGYIVEHEVGILRWDVLAGFTRP